MSIPTWLRGPVTGVPSPLQPTAHGLQQALEDLEGVMAGLEDLGPDALWNRPAGIASIGFHVRHVTGATERLFAYARQQDLTPEMQGRLDDEKTDRPVPADELLADLRRVMAESLDALRTTDPASLDDDRQVGRAQLPSDVFGLLQHAAEHAARHAGQAVTTAKVVRANLPILSEST